MSFGNPDLWQAALFLVLAGMCNGILDRLGDEVAFDRSIFRKLKRTFWLKTESWVNKWKRYKTGKLVVKKHNPDGSVVYKPRFWGSSTVFVFITDGWHLVQFLQWSFVTFAVLAAFPFSGWRYWLAWLVLKGLLSSGFTLSYDLILRARRR